MNILMLSWRGPGHPHEGGAEKVTAIHANYWAKCGHKVWWFTSEYQGALKNQKMGRIRVVRKGNQLGSVYFYAFFWYLFGKHPKFDLVVDQFHGIPFFTPLYVRARKLGYIHEVAKEVWDLNSLSWPLNKIYAFIGKNIEPLAFLLYKNNSFMTVSKSTKDDLLKWGVPRKNIHIVFNGIAVPKIKQIRKNKNKTAMFLGALAEDKGINDALLVFNKLRLFDSSWRFYIVGKGDKKNIDLIHNFTLKNSLQDSLKYFGYVSEEQKYNLLTKVHILVNTSVREGWGLVNLEANSVGTPVVGYDVPGVRDSVVNGKTGILCAKNSFDEVAEEIENLVSDKKRYFAMSHQAQKWAKRFSWQKATAQSLELIESIVI